MVASEVCNIIGGLPRCLVIDLAGPTFSFLDV